MSFPTVSEIVDGSPASTAGLAVGDELLSICGVLPSDVIEYQQLVDESDIDLTVRRGGLEWDVTIEKAPGAPLGLRLDSSIFDRVQTCDNHCEFCFIYQLPPGMRKSLYLKDDDYRLSFLYGNFTTLTRFTELDLARVVDEQLGPLYVSIHATDPAVRSSMLRNERGATSLRWLRALLDHDIEVHGQVVLCPGLNDGEILERTFAEVIVRYPKLASVGIVPLGLSRFNKESNLRVHTDEEARIVIEATEHWQEIARGQLGRRMFFVSDELYLQAGVPVPDHDAYEDFSQHENGIGMARAFYDELNELERGVGHPIVAPTGQYTSLPAAPAEGYRAPRLASLPEGLSPGGAGEEGNASRSLGVASQLQPRVGSELPVVLLTGEYGAAVIEPVRSRLERLAGRPLRVLPVPNAFFGGNVAVSGLMVGEDLKVTLAAETVPAASYLIPDVTLSGDRFLDDMTVRDVAMAAPAPLFAVPTSVAGIVAGAQR
jgi:putative radical SAM enzyme (TIGR03279 family)